MIEWIIAYFMHTTASRREIALRLGWKPTILHRLIIPAPVRFSIIASLGMFALLLIMPTRPISVPIVFGSALSLALLIYLPGRPCQKSAH